MVALTSAFRRGVDIFRGGGAMHAPMDVCVTGGDTVASCYAPPGGVGLM